MPLIPLLIGGSNTPAGPYFYVQINESARGDGIATQASGENSLPMNTINYIVGEKRQILATFSTLTAITLTLSNPTFSLYQNGSVVNGFNNVGVTSYDTAPASTVNMNYLLDTTGLAAGTYVAVFSASTLVSNGTSSVNEDIKAEVTLLLSSPGT